MLEGNYQTMIVYLFVFVLVIILLFILSAPIKWLFKILAGSIVGTFGLIVFNFIGQYIGITIGINPGSILTVGILGIPGFMLLVFLKVFLFRF